MRAISKSLFLFFILTVDCTNPSHAAQPSKNRGAATPSEVYNSFETALKTKDLRAFMKVCSKPLSNFSPGFSCGSILNEAWHEGRTYSKTKENLSSPTGKKAVIEILTTDVKKVSSPLFFLLEKTEHDLWLIKNINNNQAYAEQYLKQ